jgi:hypothetical protein
MHLPLFRESDSVLRTGKQEMPGDNYRVNANECMEAADRTSDPGRKVSLLELARRWLRLAEQSHNRKAVTGEALLDPSGGADRRTH